MVMPMVLKFDKTIVDYTNEFCHVSLQGNLPEIAEEDEASFQQFS